MLCLGREPTKTEHLEQKKFPHVLCLGREPTNTEHLGEKKIDSSSYWGNFFSQMLCLGREPTKTEHLRNFFSFDIVEIIILLVCVFLFL